MKLCELCNKEKVVEWFGSKGTRCSTCIDKAVKKVLEEWSRDRVV